MIRPSWIFIERSSLVLMKVQAISIMAFLFFLGLYLMEVYENSLFHYDGNFDGAAKWNTTCVT